VSDASTPPLTGLENDDELMALIDRAQKGDETALPALRDLLKEPAIVDATGGDLAKLAQQKLIDKFSGQNLMLRESLTRKLDLLRGELAGPEQTPLERLLVERIVTCWLHLHHLDVIYAGKEGTRPELGNFFHRSISAAQKRYLAAIKTLAAVRKLALPVLQVNIARRQVNVAGSCVATESQRGVPGKAANSTN
jgi:hypothetical protein